MSRRRGWLVFGAFAGVLLLFIAFVTYHEDQPPTHSAQFLPAPVSAGPPLVGELPLVPWEGGPAYYGGFSKMVEAGWTEPGFFPIGVWYEAVTSRRDVELDKSAGLNTYFELTASTDISLIRDAGMFALPSHPPAGMGRETVGWMLTDEVDLWGHEGDAPWTGNSPGQGPICIPENALCGYTVLQTLRDRLPADDGRARYANFGFGLSFFIKDEAAKRFLDYTDISSLDVYWYTDEGMCDLSKTPQVLCRTSASYGANVDRMRALDGMDGKRQPIYAFIEVGYPFPKFDREILPEELTGAVMNSIIHEARGIIYFNHNFGSDCISQHVLRDACGAKIRPAVTAVNRKITELAPVLNTQSIRHTFSIDMDTMLKKHGDSYYVFAMIGRGAPVGEHVLTLPAGLAASQAEVLYENRTVPVVDGKIVDTFAAEHTHHIYQLKP